MSRKFFSLFVVSFCLLGGWFLAGSLGGLTPPAHAFQEQNTYLCRWTEESITIDGEPSEAAWKDAVEIDSFSIPWKKQLPKTKTKAKLLWDRENLYFFAHMEDASLFANIKEQDGKLWDNDVFELFFKPADDKPGYFEFQVNPLNTKLDMFLPSRDGGGYDKFKSDGLFHLTTQVKLHGSPEATSNGDKGWQVEGKIPWVDFIKAGGRPMRDETWKFALCRYDFDKQGKNPELSTSAPLTKPSFHHYEDYQKIQFVGGPKLGDLPISKRLGIPGCMVEGSPEPPLPYQAKKVFAKQKSDFYLINVEHQPGSNLLIASEQENDWGQGRGRIVRFEDTADSTKRETLLEWKDHVFYSIAFHPNFATNGYLYLGGNGVDPALNKRFSKVVRFTMATSAPYKLDEKSAVEILRWESDGHNGAALCFGNDGMLYVTTGDGTNDSDRNIVGQRLDTLLAKVLRIDVDHPEVGKQYRIPKDNPFVNHKGAVGETWTYGMRNPWRMCADKKTGHIWVGQNGQDLWEMVYLVQKGANYGWSIMEGSHSFYLNRERGPTPISPPTLEHHHSEFRSLTGGMVYHGSKYPELAGAYIYGDYSTGKIWAAKHDGTKLLWHKEICDSKLQITSFGTDSSGELLITDHREKGQSGYYALMPTPKDLPPSTFPKKLSQSGLFSEVKGHRVAPGVIPYSVNAPFWSDGAIKSRFVAIPDPRLKAEFTRNKGWNFPDSTVIIKSFALEMEEGNPASQKFIETRFMVKENGNWNGYSYLWNEQQSDAELVARGGLDKDFTIKVPSSKDFPEGVRTQKWHYPSRAECMVCHSRAANFVLGLNEVQMNKMHSYDGKEAHQFAVWEQLGMFHFGSTEDIKKSFFEESKAKGNDDGQSWTFAWTQMNAGEQRPFRDTGMLPMNLASYGKLVDPHDPKADLTQRVRSYLHSNCASCHVEAGGGNAQMELEITTSLDRMKIIDVKPNHHTFGMADARLIAPGHPERSVLLHRISHRGEGYMPPLSTNVIDQKAKALLEEWIRSLPEAKK